MIRLAIIIAILASFRTAAAFGMTADSLDCRPRLNQVIVPAALIAAGSVGASDGWWRDNIDRRVDDALGSSRQWRIADAAEWVPYAFVIGGEYVGGRTSALVIDRTLLAASSFIILEAVTQPVKRIVGRRRPDGSDCHSFPSGHTATAFAGAELTRELYGNGVGIGAYIVATGVAAMRMAGRHHYLSDCIVGAGTGILSARLAIWLLPWERKILRLDSNKVSQSSSSASTAAVPVLIPVVSKDAVALSFLLSF